MPSFKRLASTFAIALLIGTSHGSAVAAMSSSHAGTFAAKLTPSEARARWERISKGRQGKIGVLRQTKSWAAVEHWLVSQGFEVVMGYTPTVGADSVSSDVNYGIAVYYDDLSGGLRHRRHLAMEQPCSDNRAWTV